MSRSAMSWGCAARSSGELDAIWNQMKTSITLDELVSRGEYLTARLMAEYLGYAFVDAKMSSVSVMTEALTLISAKRACSGWRATTSPLSSRAFTAARRTARSAS